MKDLDLIPNNDDNLVLRRRAGLMMCVIYPHLPSVTALKHIDPEKIEHWTWVKKRSRILYQGFRIEPITVDLPNDCAVFRPCVCEVNGEWHVWDGILTPVGYAILQQTRDAST